MKPRSRLALGLLLLGVLLVPPNIFSSGSWIEATFVLQHQPDEPLKAFDGGKLGILRPKFDRRYLVIAYRYLEQKPLTAQERHSLGDDAVPQVTPPGTPYDPDPPVTAWLKTRSHVLGLKEVQKIDIQRYRRNGFAEYPNCGDDAFTNASTTAMSRAQTFGIALGDLCASGLRVRTRSSRTAVALRTFGITVRTRSGRSRPCTCRLQQPWTMRY